MKWVVSPGFAGTADQTPVLSVPGDKSISHRALMLAALAHGRSSIANLSTGEDVGSTIRCLRRLGVFIDCDETIATVAGNDLSECSALLDAGNSGTTLRLLAGILAGHPFSSTLTGDESLRKRPMNRIAEPLRAMGASVSTENGRPPLVVRGGHLAGITYEATAPSAQVKSCILLAGLFASGETTVIETIQTRDHTERMLTAAGIPLRRDGLAVTASAGRPQALVMQVPGDFSAAAPLFALGALKMAVEVRGVGINPTRTAFLSVLRRMGAEVSVMPSSDKNSEPVANVRVTPGALHGLEIGADEAPLLIDELPLVALLGAVACGSTSVFGAGELRVKESDRIMCVAQELNRLGASVDEMADGFVVRGGKRLRGGECTSHGDHRIAMMLAVAGTVAQEVTTIDQIECADISFPGFRAAMQATGITIGLA